MFEVLGVKPLLGRGFAEDEFVTGRDRVLVLGHGIWQRRFGADPGIVGRTLVLSGEPYTVIGVMPEGFQFAPFWATRAELAAPLDLAPRATARTGNSLRIFARLKASASREQAQVEMDAICQQLAEAYPKTNTGRTARVTPLLEQTVGNVRAFAVDGQTLLFTLALALLTGLAFGLVPAWQAARAVQQDALQDGSRGATGGRRGLRIRSVLVVTEIALALITLIGAGLLLRSFARMTTLDPGFEPQNGLTMLVSLHGQGELTGAKREAFYHELSVRFGRCPSWFRRAR